MATPNQSLVNISRNSSQIKSYGKQKLFILSVLLYARMQVLYMYVFQLYYVVCTYGVYTVVVVGERCVVVMFCVGTQSGNRISL